MNTKHKESPVLLVLKSKTNKASHVLFNKLINPKDSAVPVFPSQKLMNVIHPNLMRGFDPSFFKNPSPITIAKALLEEDFIRTKKKTVWR